MTDPRTLAATQLANIENATGTTLEEFSAAVAEQGLVEHGQIVSFLEAEHGLTHGNANLVAQLVRDELAGGAPTPTELLDAQYRGRKAQLRPIYERLASIASRLGDDVDTIIQKSGVSFRVTRQFALVQAPSSKRVRLGLKLDEPIANPRLEEASGMCSHTLDITAIDEIDDSVRSWIAVAYEAAGGRG